MQWLLLLPGFVAGIFFWPRIIRWGCLVFFAAQGRQDRLSKLAAPGGRVSLIAAFINSGLLLAAGLTALTILYLLGKLPPGSGDALAGFYAALLLMTLHAKRLLRTAGSREATIAARDRKVEWIIRHKAGLFLEMALGWSIPMTITFAVITPSMSAGQLFYMFGVSFVGGLLIATLMWFTIIRVAVDDYQYKRRRAGKGTQPS